jgi:hypothetical protein
MIKLKIIIEYILFCIMQIIIFKLKEAPEGKMKYRGLQLQQFKTYGLLRLSFSAFLVEFCRATWAMDAYFNEKSQNFFISLKI